MALTAGQVLAQRRKTAHPSSDAQTQALGGTFRGPFTAATTYGKGDLVSAPDGSLQASKASFLSGGSFNQADWDSIVVGSAGAADSTTTTKGIAKISVAPASPSQPIAVGDNDPRMTDVRTPSDASVTNAKVAGGAAIAESKLALASDAAAGTASRRTLGTGATQAAAGNHNHDAAYAALAAPAAAVTAHSTDTTDVHGIPDTASVVLALVKSGGSYPARPTGAVRLFVGDTDPGGSALDNDLWILNA